MLLAATFLTTHFGEWKQSWHGMSRGAKPALPIADHVPPENEGAIAFFDLTTGELLRHLVLDTPSGFGFRGDSAFVCSMYGNRIVRLDRTGEIADTMSIPLMNDMHSLVCKSDSLVVTSSGTDAILELSLDGRLLWSWLACRHGYDRTPHGALRKIERDVDYRRRLIGTTDQATHCNCALPARHDGRDVLLTLLFHGGQLVSIDRMTGKPRVLLSGMSNPHSLRARRGGGWIVCDSRASSVVILDEGFWVEDVIEADFNWVQDAVELDDRTILIADANNSRLVVWDLAGRRVCREIRYPEEWKIYQIEVMVDGPPWAKE